MINDIGGRKFILAVMALILTTFLCWFDHIADGIYSVVAVAIVGAYITGNVVAKTKEGTATVDTSK
jgi:hypothetical protein